MSSAVVFQQPGKRQLGACADVNTTIRKTAGQRKIGDLLHRRRHSGRVVVGFGPGGAACERCAVTTNRVAGFTALTLMRIVATVSGARVLGLGTQVTTALATEHGVDPVDVVTIAPVMARSAGSGSVVNSTPVDDAFAWGSI